MREKLSSKVSVFGKSLPVWAVLLAMGGASAAVATVVASPLQGQVTVNNGLSFQYDSGVTTNDNGAFTTTVNNGGTFSYGYTKKNLANDETEPLVETVVIDASKGLDYHTLEKVRWEGFDTDDSTTNHLPANSTSDDDTKKLIQEITVSADGTVSGNTGNLQITNADVNSDTGKEIVMCWGKDESTVSKDGFNFDSGEKWHGSYMVDTGSSFAGSDVTVNTSIRTVYNPAQQGVTDFVANYCPQTFSN